MRNQSVVGSRPPSTATPTLTGMLGTVLIGYQVVEVCQSRDKRLLAATWVVQPFHREQLPFDGVMGLIQQGAGHRHLGVCEHRLPARLLLVEPAPDALAVGFPGALGHAVGKVAQPLPQRKHPQALPLTRPVQEGVELGA